MNSLFHWFLSAGIRWLVPLTVFAGLTWYGFNATSRLTELPIEGRDQDVRHLMLPENADNDPQGNGYYARLTLHDGRVKLEKPAAHRFHRFDAKSGLLQLGPHLLRVVGKENRALVRLGWRFPKSRRTVTAGLSITRDVIFPEFNANRVFALTRNGNQFIVDHPGNRIRFKIVTPNGVVTTLTRDEPTQKIDAGSVVVVGSVPLVVSIGRRDETWVMLHPAYFTRFRGLDGRRRLSALGLYNRLKPVTVLGNHNMQFKRLIPLRKIDFQYRDAVQELIDRELIRFTDGRLVLKTTDLTSRDKTAIKLARNPVIFGGRLKHWLKRSNDALEIDRPDLAERFFRFQISRDGQLKELQRVAIDAVTRTREVHTPRIPSRLTLGTNGHPVLSGRNALIFLDSKVMLYPGWTDLGEKLSGVVAGHRHLGLHKKQLLRLPPSPGGRSLVILSTKSGTTRVEANRKGLVKLNGKPLASGIAQRLISGDRLLIGRSTFRFFGSDNRLAVSKQVDRQRRFHYPQGEMLASLLGFNNKNPGLENLWGRRDERVVQTTIDLKLQRAVHFMVTKQMKWMHSTGFLKRFPSHRFKDRRKYHRMGVVVLDAKSGSLLASVSVPSFNPTPRGYVHARDEARWFSRVRRAPDQAVNWLKPLYERSETPSALEIDLPAHLAPLRRSINRRLLNAGIFDRVPPGSTMKIVVLGAYLDYMIRRGYTLKQALNMTPRFRCLRNLSFAGHIFRCEGHHNHGLKEAKQPIIYALKKSCNIYFAKLLLLLSGLHRTSLGEQGTPKQMKYLKRYKLMAERILIDQTNMDRMRSRLSSNRYFALLRQLGFRYYYRDEKGRRLAQTTPPKAPICDLPGAPQGPLPQGQIFSPQHLSRKRLFNGGRLEYKSLYNLALTAIGSDLDVTPLHLASLMLPITNDGKTRPVVVLKGNNPPWRRVYSPAVAGFIRQAMLAVVQEGTAAKAFKDFPYKVIGKTGTSENVTFHRRGREKLKRRFIRRHGRGALRANSMFVGASVGCERDVIIAVMIKNGARVLKKPDPMEAKYLAAKLFGQLGTINGCSPSMNRNPQNK